MIITGKAEILGAVKRNTKKGEAVVVTIFDGEEVYEVWAFDSDLKKKALAKKRGDGVTLTWEGRKFNGYLQVGSLVGLE